MLSATALLAIVPPGRGDDLFLTVVVTVLVLLGRSIDFKISKAGSTHMGTPALLVGVLLLDPALAVLAVTGGAAASEIVRRAPVPAVLFNIGQATIQAFVALAVLSLAGWNPHAPDFGSPWLMSAVLCAGALAIVTSAFLVSVGASFDVGRPLGPIFKEVLLGGESKLYIIDLSKLCFGIIAAILIEVTPFHALLIIVPLATMSSVVAHTFNLRRQLEKALHETEDSLAEAQRVAQLGSWEWEMSSRYMRWSDQIFEITGIERAEGPVSLSNLRELLRIPDRVKLEHAIGRVLETHGREEFDHEVRRADGSVRYLHHVIAWASDAGQDNDRLVGTVLDITERKRLELELRHQAYHDGLTGLPNRELFLERLGECLVGANGHDPEKGVIFIDLDFFKQINDRFGHEAGDSVLIKVARRLQQHVGPHDTVARLSGDEFTVLVCNRGQRDRMIALAGDLLRAVQRPIHIDGEAIPMTASAGLVRITPRHQTPSDVIREADNALYRAKGAGRNRLSVEAPDPETDSATILRTLA